MKLSDMASPIAVWRAIEGDRSELIALLRSEKELNRRTRNALADWLDGKLQPFKLPKGRPSSFDPVLSLMVVSHYGVRDLRGRSESNCCFFGVAPLEGYDVTTEIGRAGWRYIVRRAFIREKGWHLKKAGRFYWSSERLMAKIAERHGIEYEKLANYIKRPKSNLGSSYSMQDVINRQRRKIADEIRRAKIGKKG